MSAPITVRALIEAAGELTDASFGEIVGSVREGHIMPARRAVAFLARGMGYSSTQIARAMGGRNHSSIIHHAQVCADRMARSPEFTELVARVFERAVEIQHTQRRPVSAAAIQQGI